MVGALGGAVAGQLVVCAQERRQFQGLEVMGQQHLRRIGHDAPPPNKFPITGGGRGRHVGPRQVGIDIQVEFGRASLDTAPHQSVFDGVVADRTQAQGGLHRAVKHLEIEGLQKPKDLAVFPLAGLAPARLQETAQGWEGIRQFPSG